MSRQFKVITNSEAKTHNIITPDEKLKHTRNVVGVVIQDAQDVWGDLWDQFQGAVTQGVMVTPEAEKGGFKPKCGWPEFLEKMWQLKHYLDYAKRFCDGRS